VIVAATRDELRSALAGRAPVNLVPTMGALHAGHEALLAAAVARGGLSVASIFVNPLQFGPGEDLARYPRTLDSDLAGCESAGIDVVFTPAVQTVYPGGEPRVTIEAGPQATILEGASRPGHFRGVLTVVAKLFGLVQPHTAFFGEKDYQQLALIRQMASDLCMQIEVVGVETVRDPDGLALSSRNRYLSAPERELALSLSRALRAGQGAGPHGADAVLAAGRGVFEGASGVDLDYLALRGPDLDEPPMTGEARLLVAARVGSTRLIDNVAVTLGPLRPGPVDHLPSPVLRTTDLAT
jgi:pantoate--beta-alanine ligase